MYLYAELLEKKLQDERKKRNSESKKRLEQIASGGGTIWSGSTQELKGVTATVESILSGKNLKSEYDEVIRRLDILKIDEINSLRDEILDKFSSDVFFVRLFTKYTELLGKSVQDSQLKKLNNKVDGKSPVTFYNSR